MVTLNDPITSQNIVDRFEELVTDIADTQIVWGTDNLPGHSAFTSADFGGVVDGMELVLTNATGTFTANETVTGSISGTVGTVVSYSSNTLKVRSIVPGSGQTNFLQNDILTGSNSGSTGTISTMTTVSATTIGITGTQIGTTGNPITANAIYTTLKNEMNTYTNIKETNAVVTMTGAGQQYSDTQIAHNLTSQRTTLNPSQPSTLQPGQLITSANLESFISSLANAYSTERGNTYTFTTVSYTHLRAHET